MSLLRPGIGEIDHVALRDGAHLASPEIAEKTKNGRPVRRGREVWFAGEEVVKKAPKRPTIVLFIVVFVVYAVIGMILTLRYNIVDADGASRVANGAYVVLSLDPHLAAVGFVWNPLPSFVDILFLPLLHIWPDILSRGLAGNLMSALFGAGSVVQMRKITVDRGLPRKWQALIVISFACNPMILIYGGNGLSEAPFIFFSLWAVRRLLRWMRTDNIVDLIITGIALGLGYLTRYEAAAAAAGVTLVVILVTTLRNPVHELHERFRSALVDGALVSFPFALCFIGWAFAGWITTDNAFAQFSSQYGNSAQTSGAASGIASFQKLAGGPILIVLRDLLYYEPLLPVIVVIALVVAIRHFELDCLAPLSIFGGILAFEAAAQYVGIAFAWYRFFIMSVPLAEVLVVLFWPHQTTRVAAGQPSEWIPEHFLRRWQLSRRWRGVVTTYHKVAQRFVATPRRTSLSLGLLSCILLLPAIPTTFAGMLNPLAGTQGEQSEIRRVVEPAQNPIPPYAFSNDAYIASYLDRLDLPRASVLMDTFIGFGVWLASDNLHQFVITSDADFITDLIAPAQHHIQYILVSNPVQDGAADAVNQRYPTLYRDGAGIASLVMTVPSTGDAATWRLYHVNTGSG